MKWGKMDKSAAEAMRFNLLDLVSAFAFHSKETFVAYDRVGPLEWWEMIQGDFYGSNSDHLVDQGVISKAESEPLIELAKQMDLVWDYMDTHFGDWVDMADLPEEQYQLLHIAASRFILACMKTQCNEASFES